MTLSRSSGRQPPADFISEPEHAAVKWAVDAVDEAEQPDHIEVKTHFAKLKNHSSAAASSSSSAAAAGAPPARPVWGHDKATGIVLPPEPKKPRKYTKKIDRRSTWTKITLIPCSFSQTRSTRIPSAKGGDSTRTASFAFGFVIDAAPYQTNPCVSRWLKWIGVGVLVTFAFGMYFICRHRHGSCSWVLDLNKRYVCLALLKRGRRRLDLVEIAVGSMLFAIHACVDGQSRSLAVPLWYGHVGVRSFAIASRCVRRLEVSVRRSAGAWTMLDSNHVGAQAAICAGGVPVLLYYYYYYFSHQPRRVSNCLCVWGFVCLFGSCRPHETMTIQLICCCCFIPEAPTRFPFRSVWSSTLLASSGTATLSCEVRRPTTPSTLPEPSGLQTSNRRLPNASAQGRRPSRLPSDPHRRATLQEAEPSLTSCHTRLTDWAATSSDGGDTADLHVEEGFAMHLGRSGTQAIALHPLS